MKGEKIVDILYKARQENLEKLDKVDIVMLQNDTVTITGLEAELEECLKKIENNSLKDEIKEIVCERIEIEKNISSYIKEKFYKARI